jgi:CHAD domain-containing protein
VKANFFQRSLSSQRQFRPFLDCLREDFQVERRQPRRFRRNYFDTFDWRLFASDCVLEIDEMPEPRARLCAIGKSGRVVEEDIDALRPWFGDFPGRQLRPELVRLGHQRALLCLGAVEVRASHFEIRDRRGKVLARLAKEQLLDRSRGGRGRTVATAVRLQPLRGYEDVAAKMLRALDKPAAGRADNSYRAAMRLLRRKPGDYSGRLRVRLSAKQDSRQALARVLLFLLDIAERNLEGIGADIDTEFLHDFRISCRRSRSLLTQVRGVLPPADLARFRDAFSWLSTVTGPQRDLDVFLLALPGYAAELDAGGRAALRPFQELLEAERAAEHARLLQALESERFAGFRRDWRLFLEQAAAAGGGVEDEGGQPVVTVANRSIWRVYRRLQRDGKAAGAGGYSEALHELRKTGKKLRYLLEAFRTLYPEDDIEAIIASLRKLQNVLGDIVDSAVQQSYLREWGAVLAARGGVPADTADALIQLGARREMEGAAAERKFRGRFAAFAGPETAERMRRLFGRK